MLHKLLSKENAKLSFLLSGFINILKYGCLLHVFLIFFKLLHLLLGNSSVILFEISKVSENKE